MFWCFLGVCGQKLSVMFEQQCWGLASMAREIDFQSDICIKVSVESKTRLCFTGSARVKKPL
jgi:hypothetical protein